MKRPRDFKKSRGFTLVEVLIAVTIFSLSAGAIFAAISGGLRSELRANHAITDALTARSLMAEVGVSIPLEPGESSGDFEEGGRWELSIELFDEAPPRTDAETAQIFEDAQIRLYRVTLLLVAENGRQERFVTRRLAVPEDFL